MWVCYFPRPPPQEVGAPRSARQSRLIADIYLVGGRREAVYCSESCVPRRIFSRQAAAHGNSGRKDRGRGLLSSGGNNCYESRSKSQGPRSSRAGLNQRRKVTVVYVRRSGSYGLGAVAGPGFGPPHTNPTRSLCHPPRLLLLLLSTRAAGGSGREDAYIGEEERPVARSRPAKVTICSGGVVRGGPLGQEGETGQLDGSSVTENR